jgi:GTP-binding protein
MDISSATFVISNSKISSCPQEGYPEYAFIGRSNVGKSSLINMLTGIKDLAKISSKPGKTLLMNHFLINQAWYIVDLPGYGFAKISKTMRENVHKMITTYVTKREQLVCLFVLLDSRHEAQEIDLEFLEFLGEKEVPFALIFTKTDKVTQSEAGSNIRKYKQKLLETWEELPPIFITSSEKKRGRLEILQYIEGLNESFNAEI